jgi:putative flippase GtrA
VPTALASRPIKLRPVKKGEGPAMRVRDAPSQWFLATASKFDGELTVGAQLVILCAVALHFFHWPCNPARRQVRESFLLLVGRLEGTPRTRPQAIAFGVVAAPLVGVRSSPNGRRQLEARSVLTAIKSELLKFIIVGAANTFVGIGVLFVTWRFLGFGHVAANATGYAVGLICSYVLNRSWTFQYNGSTARSVVRFLVVFAFAYGANLMVLLLARQAIGAASFAPQFAGAATYTVVGYIGSRFFAFRKGKTGGLADAKTMV